MKWPSMIVSARKFVKNKKGNNIEKKKKNRIKTARPLTTQAQTHSRRDHHEENHPPMASGLEKNLPRPLSGAVGIDLVNRAGWNLIKRHLLAKTKRNCQKIKEEAKK